MFCTNCGNEIGDAAFCRYCGQPAPERSVPVQPAQVQPAPVPPAQEKPAEVKEKKRRPWLTALIGAAAVIVIGAVLVLTGILSLKGSGGAEDAVRLQGEGFDTPEEAITAYAEGLKAQDLSAVLSTFAIESLAENENAALSVLRRQAMFSPVSQWQRKPTVNPLAQELNLELVRNAAKELVRFQVDCIATRKADPDSFYLYNSSGGAAADLGEEADSRQGIAGINSAMSIFDSVDLSGMVIGEVVSWGAMKNVYDPMVSDRFLSSLYLTYSAYGIEGFRPQGILLSIEGEDWVLILNAVKIQGRWYNFPGMSEAAFALSLATFTGGMACLPVIGSSRQDVLLMEQAGTRIIREEKAELQEAWTEEHTDYVSRLQEIYSEYGTQDENALMAAMTAEDYRFYASGFGMTYEEMIQFFCLDQYLQ